MERIIKKIANMFIVISIIAILVGIVLVSYPGMSILTMGIIVGVDLIVSGIALIIMDIRARRAKVQFDGLISGILSLILGILIVKSPEGFAAYIGLTFGIWVIISSVVGIKNAISLRGTGAPWVLTLIVNILGIIFGGVLIYSPIASSLSITIASGIVLIVNSIIGIIDMIVIKKFAKVLGEVIEENKDLLENENVEGFKSALEKALEEQDSAVVETEPEVTVIEDAPVEEAPVEEAPAEETAASEDI